MSLVTRARLATVSKTSSAANLTSRRTYSILTKPGGGRYVAGTKVPKTLATPGSSTSSSAPTDSASKASSSLNGALGKDSEGADELTIPSSDAQAKPSAGVVGSSSTSSSSQDASEKASYSTSTTSAHASGTTSSSSSSQPSQFAQTNLEPHPKPTQDAVLLHSFFSLHRPLLLLPMHASQPLFTTPLTAPHSIFRDILDQSERSHDETQFSSDAKGKSSTEKKQGRDAATLELEVELGTGKPILHSETFSAQFQGEEGEGGVIPETEADADAARLLGRSYVLNRIGSVVDWQATLKRLGDQEATREMEGITAVGSECVENDAQGEGDVVRMDSVKRKRKRKMNKHILKKKRKRERAQRRRLGK